MNIYTYLYIYIHIYFELISEILSEALCEPVESHNFLYFSWKRHTYLNIFVLSSHMPATTAPATPAKIIVNPNSPASFGDPEKHRKYFRATSLK